MAITYVKDIPDFDKKVKDVANINELELTVNQLSASMLEIQGDVTELELTVSQLSASMLEVQGDVSTLAGAVTAINDELTSEEKTITLNSTYFNSADTGNVCTCEKYGKIIILTITNLNLLTEILDNNHPVLISGLPVPKNASNYVIFGMVTGSGVQEGFRVRLSDTGDLSYWYNSSNLPTTKTINGQIIYLTN